MLGMRRKQCELLGQPGLELLLSEWIWRMPTFVPAPINNLRPIVHDLRQRWMTAPEPSRVAALADAAVELLHGASAAQVALPRL